MRSLSLLLSCSNSCASGVSSADAARAEAGPVQPIMAASVIQRHVQLVPSKLATPLAATYRGYLCSGKKCLASAQSNTDSVLV